MVFVYSDDRFVTNRISAHKRKGLFDFDDELTRNAPSNQDTIKALGERLKGGVIMEVRDTEEAKMAEDAGVKAVIVINDNPRSMPSPGIIKDIMGVVKIPVMAKVYVGHVVEAQIAQSLHVDCIVECEQLSPTGTKKYVCKDNFSVPFMCGVKSVKEMFGEAPLFGAAFIGMVRETAFIKIRGGSSEETLENVKEMRRLLKVLPIMPYYGSNALPPLMFAAGEIFTPADAAWMMALGCDGVVLGTYLFSATNSRERVETMVRAVESYKELDVLADLMTAFYSQ